MFHGNEGGRGGRYSFEEVLELGFGGLFFVGGFGGDFGLGGVLRVGL